VIIGFVVGGSQFAETSDVALVVSSAASPHISQGVGASGFRIGESSFARRTFSEAEVFPDADRV